MKTITSLWLRDSKSDRNVCNRALKRRYWRCGEFYPQSLARMHTEYWCCIFQEYQHSENWTCNCSIFPPGAEGPWRRGAGRVERRERGRTEGWRGKDANAEDGETRERKEKTWAEKELSWRWFKADIVTTSFEVTNLMRSIRELAVGSFIKV